MSQDEGGVFWVGSTGGGVVATGGVGGTAATADATEAAGTG